ncbi:MAG: alanine--tRNA ligase [Thermodesulfobacteriota bacterium]
MLSDQIRRLFLQYFAEHGHAVVDSSSLVPEDDPTLLFTNAGMVQFKRVFLGEERRSYTRAVSCQRCVRAGGKHNDLENVGYTARHHTFFEMLGNFSFGDYFKAEAIHYAWDFLTRILGLPKERLWVTVFRDDDEAAALWEKADGLLPGRIVRLGEKDNFWAMGDTGPCGPCSEILIDQGPEVGCGRPDCRVGCDCDRYLELWNLVFMQFSRNGAGKLSPLPRPCIDTGMGLERVSAVCQGRHTNYDSDLFSGLIAKVASLAGRAYGAEPRLDTAMRVIADHSRATAFLVADGVLPSNEGRGYVLRRIMRRAIRFGRVLGLPRPFFTEITDQVVAGMQASSPHLDRARQLLRQVVSNEEGRFLETLDFGLTMLAAEVERLTAAGLDTVTGEFLFRLYDTYGLPVDIVRDVAGEHRLAVDEAGFAEAMARQRRQSRAAWSGELAAAAGVGLRALAEAGLATSFVGYDCRRARSSIVALLAEDGSRLRSAASGVGLLVVCAETPFYPEAGGQVGDRGEIRGPLGRAVVQDTRRPLPQIIVHQAQLLEGTLTEGEEVELVVAEGGRQRTACNHTATHLLQAVLKEVLGEHVSQSGSLVDSERLRFDFTHFTPVAAPVLREIENRVNALVRENRPVATAVLDRDAAIASGAVALFGEKYGAEVRVVSVGEVSRELCGGTHVQATGEVGLFRILSESGVAAGIRRIEAQTGAAALGRVQEEGAQLAALADLFKVPAADLGERAERLLARQKELERERAELMARLAVSDLDRLVAEARSVAGVRVLATEVPLDSPKTLREIGDRVRDRLGSGIAALGGVLDGKAALLVIVSRDLAGRFHAGTIAKDLAARVGGSGGGRADMAQAGGPQVENLAAALAHLYEYILTSVAP